MDGKPPVILELDGSGADVGAKPGAEADAEAYAVAGLSDTDRRRLEAWSRGEGEAADPANRRLATKARAILMAADGERFVAIAEALGLPRPTLGSWRRLFRRSGPDGLPVRQSRRPAPLPVSAARRRQLEEWAGALPNESGSPEGGSPVGRSRDGRSPEGESPEALALRARAILLLADGLGRPTVARRLGVAATTVVSWSARFAARGPEGLRGRRYGGPTPARLEDLSDDDRRTLEAWTAAGPDDGPRAAKRAVRARSTLLWADGVGTAAAARALGVSEASAAMWRRLFREGGIGALDGRDPGRDRRRARLSIGDDDRRTLEAWAAAGAPAGSEAAGPDAVRLAARARAVLLAESGAEDDVIAREAGVAVYTVQEWRRSFMRNGPEGLLYRGPVRRSPPPAAPVLAPDQRRTLLAWSRGELGAGPALAKRAEAVLMAAAGRGLAGIAGAEGVSQLRLGAWLRRFAEAGPEGLRNLQERRPPAAGAGEQSGPAPPERIGPGQIGPGEAGRAPSSDREPRPLPEDHRIRLAAWAAGGDPELAKRAAAVLALADGADAASAAAAAGVVVDTVKRWWRRLGLRGPEGLVDGRTARMAARLAGRKPAPPPSLDDDVRALLEAWSAGGDPDVAERSAAVLMAASGARPPEIRRKLGTNPASLRLWVARFGEYGPDWLADPGAFASHPPRYRFGLDAAGRRTLEGWLEGGDPPLAGAAAALLKAADGANRAEAAKEAGVTPETLGRWMRVLAESGPERLASMAGRFAGLATPDSKFGGDRLGLLADWASGGGVLAGRARAVLMAREGRPWPEIAQAAGVVVNVAKRWLRNYLRLGPEGLKGRCDGPPGGAVRLGGDQRRILEGWAAGPDPRLARTAAIVLRTADGLGPAAVARELGVSKAVVFRSRSAFLAGGVDALAATRPRRKAGRGPAGADPAVPGPGAPVPSGRGAPTSLRPGPLDPPAPRPTDPQRRQLEAWAGGSDPALALRAKGVLVASAGRPPEIVADYLNDEGEGEVSPSQVIRWLRRFLAMGPRGLEDLDDLGGPDGPDRHGGRGG